MDEAKALRLHKQRLEHRSRILEQQNEQLEMQLQRLKKVIDAVSFDVFVIEFTYRMTFIMPMFCQYRTILKKKTINYRFLVPPLTEHTFSKNFFRKITKTIDIERENINSPENLKKKSMSY